MNNQEIIITDDSRQYANTITAKEFSLPSSTSISGIGLDKNSATIKKYFAEILEKIVLPVNNNEASQNATT